jgi:hypothetical protein
MNMLIQLTFVVLNISEVYYAALTRSSQVATNIRRRPRGSRARLPRDGEEGLREPFNIYLRRYTLYCTCTRVLSKVRKYCTALYFSIPRNRAVAWRLTADRARVQPDETCNNYFLSETDLHTVHEFLYVTATNLRLQHETLILIYSMVIINMKA